MNPREEKLLRFVALRLDSIVRRPTLWGTDAVVEEQVLQLIEMRRLLLDPAAVPSNDTRELMDVYLAFLAQQFGMPIATFVAAASGSPTADVEDTESEDRTVAILSRVKRWIANVAAIERTRSHRVDHTPLLFPVQEHG